ncbi:MAG: FAD-dependent oxidoreductase, partial [Leptospira sp.]|nr:FAD-dependent oxidoreductase [Leptospira sp.]
MNEFFDTIIIGSGMGGLSSASLLAKHGKKVLVLEKGTSPGGCSSSFQKAGYIFESGATTLVGWEEGLPMQSLERQLGEKFPKWELALSMMVYMDGKKIQRFGDKDAWIQESIRHFQNPIRQTVFWRLVFFFADSVWSISRRYRYFPFNSILDVVRSLPSFRPKDALAFFFSF